MHKFVKEWFKLLKYQNSCRILPSWLDTAVTAWAYPFTHLLKWILRALLSSPVLQSHRVLCSSHSSAFSTGMAAVRVSRQTK